MPVARFIHLYGSLSGMMDRKRSQPIDDTLDGSAPLSTVLSNDQIPIKEIQVIIRNYRPVHLDEPLRLGDRQVLFPKTYPIFVGWFDYRKNSKSNERFDESRER